MTPDDEHYDEHQSRLQECTAEVRSAIRRAKSTYYQAEFDKHKNDIKNTWNTIKDVLNKSQLHKENPLINKIRKSLVRKLLHHNLMIYLSILDQISLRRYTLMAKKRLRLID